MTDHHTGPHVIIVGAGPAGAVLGFLLGRSGVRTTLLERHADFTREFRGEVLMPGGLEPFQQMGLWKQLNDVPHVVIERMKLYANGKHVVELELSASVFGRYRPRWVSQPDLLEMLVAEAARFPNFRLIRGTAVRDLIRKNDRVVGVTLAGDTDNRELRGDFVIGADGRASKVRACSDLTVKRDPIPMDVVWIKVPRPKERKGSLDNELRAYAGGGHVLICAPTPDGKLQLGWLIAKGSFRDLRSRGLPALLDEMSMHVDADLAQHLEQHRKESTKPFLLSVVSDHVYSWTTPGMLLIGDAAHAMSPVGAQGINLAIRDAIVASNHLGPVFRTGSHLSECDAAAQAVQAERMEEVTTVQRLQSYPPKVLLRNAWWTRTLLHLLPYFMRGDARQFRNESVLRQFAWGVSDVRIAE